MDKKRVALIIIFVFLLITTIITLYFFLIRQKSTEHPVIENEQAVDTDFFSGMIIITEDGFNKNQIKVKTGQPSFLIGSKVDSITIIGDEIYQDGKELGQSSAIGFPLNRLANEGIEEVNLWFKDNPEDKLNIIIK